MVKISGRAPSTPTKGLSDADAAVVADPDDAPRVVRRVLGPVSLAAVSEGDEEVPVGGEPEPRAEMTSAARLREGAEQHLNVFQPAAAKPPARDFRAGAAPGTARVAQVHPSVLLEVRVEGYVEEAALAARVHPGHAGDRLGIEAARRHRAEPARAFGHEQPAVRQEREPPWMVEPGRDLHHRERVLFGFERVGRGGRRRNDETRDDRSPEHGSPGSWVAKGRFSSGASRAAVPRGGDGAPRPPAAIGFARARSPVLAPAPRTASPRQTSHASHLRGHGREPPPQSSRMATARVQPADAPRIFTGKQHTVKPSPGSASRLCSFSRWQ